MAEEGLRTEVITFRGVVQGVGFRPTIYRIAQELGMKGSVRNMGGIVQLVCTDAPGRIDFFVQEIIRRKPPMARISGTTRTAIGTTIFHGFSIGMSSAEEDEIAIIPADIAVCDDCLREYYDPGNPRYLHPFISCTNCGPRYTIMERLPYDRDTTTMDVFPMCGLCEGEYGDPASRRYHAQTISCHDCGPQPLLNSGTSEPIREAIAILKNGDIIALKGVGGYYLACTPFDEAAVRRLREIKRREQKPFAVMFRDINQIKQYCTVSPQEEAALCSPQRPILLLEPYTEGAGISAYADATGPDTLAYIDAAGSGISAPAGGHKGTVPLCPLCPGVCNTSRFVGAFLPSFGLQYALLDALGPLIMTSANISELPIITDDKTIRAFAGVLQTSDDDRIEPLAGTPTLPALYNKRRIVAGLDDSVARIIDGTIQLIRRSKGYVPSPVFVQTADTLTKDTMIFAAGSHLKSVFALSKGAYSYLSRHIGDLDSMESEAAYREAFERMKAFFEIEPLIAVCDMHPRYYSTQFAESLGLPVVMAQHHHAHIASVMAEHGLRGPVIGVSFDGTGFGTDDAVWGGEILICEDADFERFSHLKYVDMIGGDASMKDAWKSAVAYLFAGRHDDGRQGDGSLFGEGFGSLDGDFDDSSSFEIDLSRIAEYCERHDTLGSSSDNKRRHDTSTYILPGNKTAYNSSHFVPPDSERGYESPAFVPPDNDTGDEQSTYTSLSNNTGHIQSTYAFEATLAALEAGVNTFRTSSMGRLFDAVCAMLGIHYENRYEGECAIMLENAAQRAIDKERASRRPTEQERLALSFHIDIARAVQTQCRLARAERDIQRVCLSGGVFQNKILMEETLKLLREDGFAVYYNIHVPPNDGGIALGQNFIGMMTCL